MQRETEWLRPGAGSVGGEKCLQSVSTCRQMPGCSAGLCVGLGRGGSWLTPWLVAEHLAPGPWSRDG